ncbi:FG-GAP-like repeat-containing protein [Dyadobacter fermentans]|nr:FG-GAP-like repeat-containing protein [Dyadobacter fermentans]
MKHTYKRFVLVAVAVVMAIASMAYWADRDQKSNLRPGAGQSAHSKDKAVPQEALAQIQQNLIQREYHISYDSAKHVLQSPNRMQGLRAYYRPGELTIVNRKDSSGHNFELKLINKGIYADGKKLFSPQRSATNDLKNNHLQIAHAGFVEEYINEPGGVRQNFIVESAPDGTRELEVRLNAEGAQVKQVGKNELILAKQSLAKFYYRDLHCWDADGEPLEASLAYVNGDILIEVDVKNAAFPVTIDPLVVNGTPANASTLLEKDQAQAAFGYSVSSAGDINGDGYSDVIIGAPNYDKGESNEGVAFVYMGSASGLATAPDRTLEANQPDAKFGNSVANAGDVNGDGFGDVIVGAPMYDKNENNEGAAFVYHGSGAGLNAVPTTTLESNQPDANLGQFVAAAGDVNNDGLSDVITGAPMYDKGHSNEGAAFVYHGTLAGISNVPITTLESNQIDAQFGCSVKGAGDVDGDGYSDVIVGASMYDKGESNEGAAFVYHGSINGIATAAKTTLENNQAAAFFGFSASTAGDVNGDGFSDVIVGSFHFDNGQNNEGGAFVYHGSANGISTTIAKQLECNQAGAQYGASVASAGDVNGDGYADVIVGANLFDNGQGNEGGAFVYEGSSSGLGNTSASSQEGNQLNAYLGSSVSSAGDVNGDGYSDIVVGGQGYDKGDADEGVALVWLGGARSIKETVVTHLEMNVPGIQFGWSVASAGDVNGDGFGDVIISANNYDGGQAYEGAAFVFHGSSQGLSGVPSYTFEGNQQYASLGSVASAGDVNGDGFDDVIIGIPLYDNAAENTGKVCILYGSGSGLGIGGGNLPQTTILGTQEDARFGSAVSSAGDVNKDGYADIIIGETEYDISSPYTDEGRVHIYYGSSNGVNLNANPTIINGSIVGVYLGSSVAGGSDVNGDGFGDILVANPYYTNGQNFDGAVFIYNGSQAGINPANPTILHNNFKGEDLIGVANAGDLNGDGYTDVVVGSPKYSNGQLQEGALFIFYGSANGINTVPVILEKNVTNGYLGKVSAAGDVNGDGYSDLVVGSTGFSNNEVNEGAVYLFFGSPAGLTAANCLTIESNQNSAFLGNSVAGAGDINGDGYSDIIASAHQYDNNQQNEGRAFVYYGNSTLGTRNNLRLYNSSDLTTPINHTQFAQNNFGAGLYAKSFLGRNKAKLVWETKPANQGFSKGSNNSITNSTQSTSSQNAYSNLGLAGIELKNVINKQGAGTKMRVRVKYDPVLALTGQTYGPWRYLPVYLMGNSTSPTPENTEDNLSRTTKNKNMIDLNRWSDQVSVFPNPATDYLNIDARNPEQVKAIKILNIKGVVIYQTSGFESPIDLKSLARGVYFVIVTNHEGVQTTRKIMVAR